jgi:hypothetical protein
MSSVPPGSSPLRLPLGEVVFYPTGRPSIRTLVSHIVAFGYSVTVYPFPHADLATLPPGVWYWAVVISENILFIVLPPTPTSSESSSVQPPASSESSLDQSDGGSSSYNNWAYYDSDNIDPDAPCLGRGYWHT